MRRAALLVSLVFATSAMGCGSSGGGGTGGGGGTAAAGAGGGASGGAGGNGATAGAAGSGGAGGASLGTGGQAGAGGAGGSLTCGDSTAAGSGATCNTFTAAGPCVTSTSSTGTTPTPAGGTFVAGTYNLTSRTYYAVGDAGPGVSPQTGRQTMIVSSVTADSLILDQVETSGTAVARSHGSVSITGMTATYTPTCPAPTGDAGGDDGGTAEFTATSTSITLFESIDGYIEVSVYARTS